ncbi:hypothetical protein PG997_013176 [Apiospora hydei]|uniref:Uncharacterized protein n=1 Tax=Apiospora hydei TaxID=1337664 RepID=A0ABR1V5F3_9PEZI
MKTMQIAPMAGLLAAANAWGTTGGAEGTAYTTLVTTDYVTYCPEPTTFAYKNVTYTVTSATTLTITTPASDDYVVLPAYLVPHRYGPALLAFPVLLVPLAPPGAPTNTPIAPTTTGSVPIPTAGAAKAGTVGALLAVAGLAIAL